MVYLLLCAINMIICYQNNISNVKSYGAFSYLTEPVHRITTCLAVSNTSLAAATVLTYTPKTYYQTHNNDIIYV